MRALATLALTLTAVLSLGCSYAPTLPVRMSTAPVQAPADVEHKEGTFAGVRGTQLYEQSWRPRGEARAVVVIVHGLKDHSSRYQALAERLAQQGFAVHAFDLRGHGRSEGLRVWVDSFDDHLGDLDIFMGRLKEEEKGKPTLLFGHSMGGAISTLYTITHKPDLKGLVLSGAALAIDTPAAVVGGSKFVAALSPAAALFQLDLKQFSRDPAVLADNEKDPLVHQPPAPVHTAVELLGAVERIQAHMEEITVPLFVMHGEADKVTPPEGSKTLVQRARSTDKVLKLYPGLYHDLLHEPEREKVMADVVKWMSEHAPGGAPAPAAAPPAPPAPQ